MTLLLPYRQVTAPKTDYSEANPTEKVRFTRQFSGFGDAVLLAQLLAKPSSAKSPLMLGVGFGFRLPTGASQPDHQWAGGLSRDPVLQVGAGTLDPIGSLTAGYRLGKTSIYTNALARISGGQNIHSYRYGNEYQLSAGFRRPVSEWFDASLTATTILTGHDYDKGSIVGNTGGTWFYLTPGISFRSGDINTGFSLQLPLYQNVNLSQLSSSYVFNANFSCGFDLGKNKSAASKSTRTVLPPPTGAPSGFEKFDETTKHHSPDVSTVSLGAEVTLADYTKAGKITLFEFYGDKCTACAAFEGPLREFLNSNPDFILRKINIGDGESKVVKQHNITVTPTIIAIDETGKELLRQDGATIAALESLTQNK